MRSQIADLRLQIGGVRGTLPPMAENWKCMQCDKEEQRCECVKYCCLCQGSDNPRLCADGLYYCRDCREICGYVVAGDL